MTKGLAVVPYRAYTSHMSHYTCAYLGPRNPPCAVPVLLICNHWYSTQLSLSDTYITFQHVDAPISNR